MNFTGRFLLLTSLFTALAVGLGCGKGNSRSTANATGKVTYKGQPVTGGRITFYTKEAGMYSGTISPEGTYTLTELPVGEMVVTVETESLNPKAKTQTYGPRGRSAPKGVEQMSPMPEGANTLGSGTYVKIPAKYNNRLKSPLKATLDPGENTKNFELTD